MYTYKTLFRGQHISNKGHYENTHDFFFRKHTFLEVYRNSLQEKHAAILRRPSTGNSNLKIILKNYCHFLWRVGPIVVS